MSDTPTRAQIIDATRALVLRDGSQFSLASICRQLNCSRSYLRRYFPNKATLIAAIFDRAPPEALPKINAHIDASPEAVLRAAIDADKDLTERRFRIFERAVATLEGQIETLRTDNAKLFARLDKKFIKLANSSSKGKPESSLIAPDETEHNNFGTRLKPELEAVQELDYLSDDLVSEGPGHVDSILSASAILPATPVSVLNIADSIDASESDIFNQESELVFTTAPEQPPDKESLKENLVFGFAVFIAALAFVVFVFVLSNRAGASNFPDPNHSLPSEKTKSRHSAVEKPNPIERVAMGNCIAINAAAPISTNSLASSLSAKTLRLEKASNADHEASQQTLNCDPQMKLGFALAYLRGDGVKADPMMAAFWSEAAAQQGNADAQYILGTLYAEGIKPDPVQAFRWFSSAAVQGNPKAMHNLAIALLNGVGAAQDQSSAVNWFVRAANLGYRDSAFNLGVLYERGEGVVQDPKTALAWYDKAAATGDRQAIERATVLRANGFSVISRN